MHPNVLTLLVWGWCWGRAWDSSELSRVPRVYRALARGGILGLSPRSLVPFKTQAEELRRQKGRSGGSYPPGFARLGLSWVEVVGWALLRGGGLRVGAATVWKLFIFRCKTSCSAALVTESTRMFWGFEISCNLPLGVGWGAFFLGELPAVTRSVSYRTVRGWLILSVLSAGSWEVSSR